MRKISATVLLFLAVFVCSIYLPAIYRKICMPPVEKTHLLFSPILKEFVYRERMTYKPSKEALSKTEDHHSDILYGDEEGNFYSRKQFEQILPFVYSKNMELWGFLPITIDGQSFDHASIKKERQVLELYPGRLPENNPGISLWPLLETESDQVRLVFPEDMYRMTQNSMEFINTDTNKVDSELTEIFTQALLEKGFVFPARSVNTRVSVLKPFDEGAFIVDAHYQVFHVKRVHNRPRVIKTPISPELRTRFILISEKVWRKYYGLLLGGDRKLYLLSYDKYTPIPLPIEGYNPDTMDVKVLTDPLYVTVVWSDHNIIHGVAMDTSYSPVATYSHRMSRARGGGEQWAYKILFPFVIHVQHPRRANMDFSLQWGGWLSLIGLGMSLGLLFICSRIRKRERPKSYEIVLVACTGIYGLIALFLINPKK